MSHNHDSSDAGRARYRPSFKAFFNNFGSYDAPFHEKLALALRNTLIKIRNRSDCCGNHGEPGC